MVKPLLYLFTRASQRLLCAFIIALVIAIGGAYSWSVRTVTDWLVRRVDVSNSCETWFPENCSYERTIVL